MQANRIHINEFLTGTKDHLLLDVRSPAEYTHAHIPGAINLPLFSNEERKIVGTAYKQKSREKAIKIGLDFFGPKMRGMVEEVEHMLDVRCTMPDVNDIQPRTSNIVYVYCWRGGMRSGAVSWLLNLYGFKVYTLAGGYKSFRNHVLKTFEQPFDFKILGGYTGSGKTSLLKELERKGETVIDLEAIACHKGSAFGNIKMPAQPTQEMFENLLAKEFWNKTIVNGEPSMESPESDNSHSPFTTHYSPIWLEDESQRIGNLNIPMSLWNTMRMSPLYFLEVPFEERLNCLVEEYGQCDAQKLMEATQRISKRLGGLETKNTLAFFEEGNIREAFSILLHYYDKRYLKGLHNREDISALLIKISCEKVSPLNSQALLNQYQNL
jgi:tRNA 2-selenouridine synthase